VAVPMISRIAPTGSGLDSIGRSAASRNGDRSLAVDQKSDHERIDDADGGDFGGGGDALDTAITDHDGSGPRAGQMKNALTIRRRSPEVT